MVQDKMWITNFQNFKIHYTTTSKKKNQGRKKLNENQRFSLRLVDCTNVISHQKVP